MEDRQKTCKLFEVKSVGDETWEDLKADTKKIWNEVKTAIRRAASKFK